MFKRIVTMTVALWWSGLAFAAHPLITDDASTQGKGKFQMELNGEYGHDRDDGVVTKTAQIAATLSYGLSDPLDIILSVPYEHTRIEDSGTVTKGDGATDMSVEFKWRFYEKDGLSFALKPGLTLPAGDEEKGLGAGSATYHIFFVATKELKPWAFHANLGYIRNENKRDERKNLWHASAAAVVEVIEDLKVVGNLGIERNIDRNLNIHPAFILAGFIYSLYENLDIDAGVKAGLNRAEANYALLAGLTYRF